MSTNIKVVKAREILSAGAFPTIETSIILENGVTGKASVPFGSSAGEHEATTLLDNDKERYGGNGVLTAVENVNSKIAESILGMDVLDQQKIDSRLNELDPSPRKESIGGNSVLSVSLATARTAANAQEMWLFRKIMESYGIDETVSTVPKPMMVMIEGGKHADNSTDFQEYLIAVDLNRSTKERVRAGIETYHALAEILNQQNLSTNVGLEGAFAPNGIDSNSAPLMLIVDAIVRAGYRTGQDINLALDTAASEFYKENSYNLKVEEKVLNADDLLLYYRELVEKFPIVSIEDPFAEDDWDAWKKFYQELNEKILVVGDDLTVSQLSRLKKASELNTINSIIIKPNQAGTLTEIMDTVGFAKENGYKIIVSHRGGGETTDTFIADLGVAVQAEYVKIGPSRGERVVKYNRLMEIAEKLAL